MTHDESIERYWNSIQDWTTLTAHPIKIGLDKIFMKFLIRTEGIGYKVKTMVELADITDPFSYVVIAKDGDKEASFTIYINSIHNRNIADDESKILPIFDEDKFSKWKPSDDTFDIGIWDMDLGYAKIGDWTLNDLTSGQLIVFAKALMSEDPKAVFKGINDLPEGEFQTELYNITGDEEYLPADAKEMFLF